MENFEEVPLTTIIDEENPQVVGAHPDTGNPSLQHLLQAESIETVSEHSGSSEDREANRVPLIEGTETSESNLEVLESHQSHQIIQDHHRSRLLTFLDNAGVILLRVCCFIVFLFIAVLLAFFFALL